MNPYVEKYVSDEQEYENEERTIKDQIKKWEKRLEMKRKNRPDWIEDVVKPIARKLSKRKGLPWRVFGPCGLRCEVYVCLMEGAGENQLKNSEYFLCLTPEHHGDREFTVYYDTGSKSEEYPKNSIGEINGFGNERKELPDTIEEIESLLICVLHIE